MTFLFRHWWVGEDNMPSSSGIREHAVVAGILPKDIN